MNEKNVNNKKDETLKRNKNEIVFYRVGKQRLKSNRKFYILSIILYIVINIIVWKNSEKVLNLMDLDDSFRFYLVWKIMICTLSSLIIWIINRAIITLLGVIGRPADAKEVEETFEDNGFVTEKSKQPPLLLVKRKDKTKEDSIEYEFYNRGISIEKWNFLNLENWLDGYITYLDYAKNTKKNTIIRITPTEKYKPFILTTKNNKMVQKPKHTLLCGESGSGKSFGALTMMYQYAKSPNTSITLIDGKAEGYEQFDKIEEEGKIIEEKAKNFYSGEHPEEGIKNFYENVFQYKRKNKKDKEFKKITHILILEEYSSILQDLGKQEPEIKKMVSRMLKMGRSLNCWVWTCEQKPMAEYYANARNNFRSKDYIRPYGKANRRNAI